MSENGSRKRRKGLVVSDSMDKTLVVEAELIKIHDLYKKYLRRNSRHKVHDEDEEAGVGDVVEIEETRPISKSKCWRLVEVVEEASAEQRAKVEQAEDVLESDDGSEEIESESESTEDQTNKEDNTEDEEG